MIGQNNIKTKLKSYQLADLPRSLLFVGDPGCGKHTLANDLASYFGIELVDITETISAELIADISIEVFPKFYLINADNLTDRDQNVILKFIEEPSPAAYIIIISTSRSLLLPTVLNRCNVYEFEQYTKEELNPFLVFTGDEKTKDIILNICKTPGQLVNLDTARMPELIELCNKIATKMQLANFANCLTIADKINYKDEYSKYDLNIFMDALIYELMQESASGNDRAYNMYLKTVDYKKRLKDKRLNKEVFMYNFLTVLWKTARA